MQSYLPENLVTLRKIAGKTQEETASLLGLSRSTYVNYEKGGNEPNINTLFKMGALYAVPVDTLIAEKLAKGNLKEKAKDKKSDKIGNLIGNPMGNPIEEKAAESAKSERVNKARLALSEAENYFREPGRPNVYDLSGAAAAGAAIALLEEDKVKPAPTLYLPEIGHGLNIRIRAVGDSMYPTIKPEDRVVATWVADGSRAIREGHVHVVIDANDEVAVKRVYLAPKNRLQLVSDNSVHLPYFLHLGDVQAVFEVKQVHSSDLRHELLDMRLEMREIRTEWERMRPLMEKMQAIFESQ